MRELVIISLNIIYVKDTMQACERLQTKARYLNIPDGSIKVTIQELLRRKHSLNKRMKRELEYLVNSGRRESNFIFDIPVEHACLTKKQLEKGYMLLTNIRNMTYALDIRKGALYPIDDPESNSTTDINLRYLEYTAQHDGPVYKYFEIDETDPLKNELRY